MKLDIGGETVDVDLSFDELTLREQVEFQKLLGHERYTSWWQSGAPLIEPDVLHALLVIHVRRVRPDADPDDVDTADVESLIGELRDRVRAEENPTRGS